MGGGKDGGDGVGGHGKTIGLVFAALAVGAFSGYVTSINKTAEAVSAIQARQERSEARVEGQYNLLTLKLETLNSKVDTAIREIREDKPSRRRQPERDEP